MHARIPEYDLVIVTAISRASASEVEHDIKRITSYCSGTKGNLFLDAPYVYRLMSKDRSALADTISAANSHQTIYTAMQVFKRRIPPLIKKLASATCACKTRFTDVRYEQAVHAMWQKVMQVPSGKKCTVAQASLQYLHSTVRKADDYVRMFMIFVTSKRAVPQLNALFMAGISSSIRNNKYHNVHKVKRAIDSLPPDVMRSATQHFRDTIGNLGSQYERALAAEHHESIIALWNAGFDELKQLYTVAKVMTAPGSFNVIVASQDTSGAVLALLKKLSMSISHGRA
jgi:hypothetical protein